MQNFKSHHYHTLLSDGVFKLVRHKATRRVSLGRGLAIRDPQQLRNFLNPKALLIGASLLFSFGCQSKAEKTCFADGAHSKVKLSACGEACDKNISEACVRQVEIANTMCIEQKNVEVCQWMCNYATTGKQVYCSAATEAAKPEATLLTKTALLKASQLVSTGEPYDAARERVRALLGRSSYAEATHQWWAVIEGDSCWGYTIEWMDDKVGIVSEPAKIEESEGVRYLQCTAAANHNACLARGDSGCREKFPHPDVP